MLHRDARRLAICLAALFAVIVVALPTTASAQSGSQGKRQGGHHLRYRIGTRGDRILGRDPHVIEKELSGVLTLLTDLLQNPTTAESFPDRNATLTTPARVCP